LRLEGRLGVMAMGDAMSGLLRGQNH
jgi:hypothetical protein